MALSKVVIDTTTGSGKSITGLASGSSFTTDSWDIRNGIAHGVQIAMNNASGTPDPSKGDIVVEVYVSQDNTNYTSESVFVASYAPDTTSGLYSFVFDGLEYAYMKVKITNNMKQSDDTLVSADFAVSVLEVRN